MYEKSDTLEQDPLRSGMRTAGSRSCNYRLPRP